MLKSLLLKSPTESLLKGIIKRGLVRKGKERINLPKKSFKNLFIPALAYGVSWETICNLNRFVQSIPLDTEEKKGSIRLEPLRTRMIISRSSISAKFRKFGMKIGLPCRRCTGKKGSVQCNKVVFRRNKCEDRSHRCVVAHHCRYHERQLGCGLCFEEEEEEDEEMVCWDCGEELVMCDSCTDFFCMDCDDGNFCDSCEELFCSDDYCGCSCEASDDDEDDEEEEEHEDPDFIPFNQLSIQDDEKV